MKKILIIEDDIDLRESLIEILELNDFKMYQAPNGKIGYECIKDEDFDMVLCDINMPEMNGFELLEKVNLEIKDKPKFIFITAKVEKQDIQKGLALGALEYLIKPFDHRQIVERINYHLNNAEL
jgi:DNA-binding response OmpR family regulator